MHAANALPVQPVLQRRGVEIFGLAQHIVANTDMLQRYRPPNAGADRFGKSLFGGKPFGQKNRRPHGSGKLRQFHRMQDTFGKRTAVFLMQLFNTLHIGQIGTYSVNHLHPFLPFARHSLSIFQAV
jgi:hypothetical protein